MYTVMKDGAGIYVFHADTEDANFGRALTDSSLKLSSCCVWASRPCSWALRLPLAARAGSLRQEAKGSAPAYSDRKQTTVWNFDRPMRNLEHPTM
jgi:DNA modification methylase